MSLAVYRENIVVVVKNPVVDPAVNIDRASLSWYLQPANAVNVYTVLVEVCHRRQPQRMHVAVTQIPGR